MTLHTQLITMIAMIIGGLYLGFATETYRRVLYKWRTHWIVRYCFEIGYWVLQTCILFYLLYRTNDGEVRLFIGLASLLGYSMYIVLCQLWYRKLLEVIITVIRTIVNWTIHCLEVLIVQPVIWLLKAILYLLKGMYHILLKLLYILCYPVIFLLKKYLPEQFLKNISKLPMFCSTIGDKLKEYWKRIREKRR